MSAPALTGGCQCGNVRYRIEVPLGPAGICHCRMCQKAFGSWGAALVSVATAGLLWTRGHPGEFCSSAIVARGFCRDCGTPLYMREEGDPNHEIAIGTLDRPEAATPTRQSGIESELPWFASLHTLPRETTADTRTPEDLKRLESLQHPDRDTEEWPPRG